MKFSHAGALTLLALLCAVWFALMVQIGVMRKWPFFLIMLNAVGPVVVILLLIKG